MHDVCSRALQVQTAFSDGKRGGLQVCCLHWHGESGKARGGLCLAVSLGAACQPLLHFLNTTFQRCDRGMSQTWPMSTPAIPYSDAANASTTFVVSHRAASLRPTRRYVCQESATVTSGHGVVRRKAMPQLLHRPDSAANPHAYGFSHPHTAVPGQTETRIAFYG